MGDRLTRRDEGDEATSSEVVVMPLIDASFRTQHHVISRRHAGRPARRGPRRRRRAEEEQQEAQGAGKLYGQADGDSEEYQGQG